MRRRVDPPSTDGWVDVFATGTTLARDVRAPAARPTAGTATEPDIDTDARRLLVDHGPPIRRVAPATQPFGGANPSVRTGRHDVVRPVHVDPSWASGLAVSGRLLDAPVPHLEIARDDDLASRYLLWNTRLVSRRRRALPAALHLSASQSMVVTVLELVPRQRVRWGRRRFVRDGVAAVEVIARRLEHAERTARLRTSAS